MSTGRHVTAILDRLRPFERQQAERCLATGIDVRTMPVSHVAVRCRT